METHKFESVHLIERLIDEEISVRIHFMPDVRNPPRLVRGVGACYCATTPLPLLLLLPLLLAPWLPFLDFFPSFSLAAFAAATFFGGMCE